MTIIIRRPWTRQPQQSVGINRASPLARGLVLAINPAVGLINLAGSGNGSAQPTKEPRVSGVQHRPSASVAYSLDARVIDHTGPMSGFCVMRPQSGFAGVDVVGNRSGGGFGFSIGGSADFAGTAITYYGVASYVSTVTYDAYRGAFDRRTSFGFSILPNSTGGAKFFADGSPLGNAVNTNTPGASAANLGIYQRGDSGGLSSAVVYEVLFLWSRVLTDIEQALVHANPWQLFAPRQIIIPYAAAGAAAPTISALSAINITATSAQPRITYTF